MWLEKRVILSIEQSAILSEGSLVCLQHAGRSSFICNRHESLHIISGLDPAGPEYEVEVNPARGIRPNDAQFVDIIHTNVGEFGITRRVGHIDFYVNTGNTQPECATAVNDVCRFTNCN